MNNIFLYLMLLIISECSGQVTWLAHGEYEYYISTKDVILETAKSDCKELDSDAVVASIKSENIQMFIMNNLISSTPAEYFLGAMKQVYNSPIQPQYFEWFDGTLIDYNNFVSPEPDNDPNPAECVVLDASDGKWKTEGCYTSKYYICQRDNPNPPSTVSTTTTTETSTKFTTVITKYDSTTTTIKEVETSKSPDQCNCDNNVDETLLIIIIVVAVVDDLLVIIISIICWKQKMRSFLKNKHDTSQVHCNVMSEENRNKEELDEEDNKQNNKDDESTSIKPQSNYFNHSKASHNSDPNNPYETVIDGKENKYINIASMSGQDNAEYIELNSDINKEQRKEKENTKNPYQNI